MVQRPPALSSDNHPHTAAVSPRSPPYSYTRALIHIESEKENGRERGGGGVERARAKEGREEGSFHAQRRHLGPRAYVVCVCVCVCVCVSVCVRA